MSKEEQNAQPPVLLPEHRHVLEDLIRVADAEIGSLHGLARLQTERTRDLAAVISTRSVQLGQQTNREHQR
jgi:hypothetical protein